MLGRSRLGSFVLASLRANWRRDPFQATAEQLFAAITERSRATIFYTHYGVSDTLDGRFDLFTAYAFLVLAGLKEAVGNEAVATKLTTRIFASFEGALRDLGISDFGMSRRIRAMADAFYGRMDAYSKSADSDEALAEALLRNLYRGDGARAQDAKRLARVLRASREHLNVDALTDGVADFGPLPKE